MAVSYTHLDVYKRQLFDRVKLTMKDFNKKVIKAMMVTTKEAVDVPIKINQKISLKVKIRKMGEMKKLNEGRWQKNS